MTQRTLASHMTHADLSTPTEMAADARQVASALPTQRIARAASQTAPSLEYEDYPREVPKPEITVTAAAAKIANALHLHLD